MRHPVPAHEGALAVTRWPLSLALYVVLTVWIFIGRELVPEAVFIGVKSGGYEAM